MRGSLLESGHRVKDNQRKHGCCFICCVTYGLTRAAQPVRPALRQQCLILLCLWRNCQDQLGSEGPGKSHQATMPTGWKVDKRFMSSYAHGHFEPWVPLHSGHEWLLRSAGAF